MDCGYLGKEEAAAFISELFLVGRMLQTMINKARLFCYKTRSKR